MLETSLLLEKATVSLEVSMGGNADGICRSLALIVFHSVDTWAENLARLDPDDYDVFVRGSNQNVFLVQAKKSLFRDLFRGSSVG